MGLNPRRQGMGGLGIRTLKSELAEVNTHDFFFSLVLFFVFLLLFVFGSFLLLLFNKKILYIYIYLYRKC